MEANEIRQQIIRLATKRAADSAPKPDPKPIKINTLYPTMDTPQEAIELAYQVLSDCDSTDVYAMLMVYQNTILSIQQSNSQ